MLALDVGERRIGVARCSLLARLPEPLTTLEHTADVIQDVQRLVAQEQAVQLVVGLPRGLSGQHTPQTAYVEAFMTALEPALHIPCAWQDEALTSQKAEAELKRRGKPYAKGDIDALSATYILEDFLRDHPEAA
ncbi:MAG TPA: Holliday junction resolvase RuvX [Candidatus Saccharimonadales bacterium]|nr:Holliday junction resolvase RuvX [Candidatus Saccharimonadales bacterium]